jgi:hypothetical protein
VIWSSRPRDAPGQALRTVPARSSIGDVGTEISAAPLHRGGELASEDVTYIDQRARDLYEQAVAIATEVELTPAHRLG